MLEKHTILCVTLLAIAPMLAAPLALASQIIGQLTDPEQPGESEFVDILSARIEQDGGLLTFVIETRGDIPTVLANPADSLTFLWLVDADNNPGTGQPHEALGSEFNVRAVISEMYGGGFVDVTGSLPGGGLGTVVVQANRVQITIGLSQIGNPGQFHWGCDACHAVDNVCISANHETAAAVATPLPYLPPAHVASTTPLLMLCPSGPATGQLDVEVRDNLGNLLPIADYHLTFTSNNEPVATVDASGLVTAHQAPAEFGDTSYVHVSADGVSAGNSALIRVTSTDLEVDHQMYPGENVSFYLPSLIEEVDLDAVTTGYQVVEATDLAYQAQHVATGTTPSNGGIQYLVLDVTDNPATVPCGINGNPIRLGWQFGSPIHNNCYIVDAIANRVPRWFIFWHEMGHNFTFTSWGFWQFCNAPSAHNGTYSEGLASLCAMWSHYSIMACPSVLDPLVVDEIEERFSHQSGYWHYRLIDYQKAGADYSTFDAHILNAILYEMYYAYGLEVWFDLFSTFLPPDETLPYNLDSEAKQATWFVAAMSASTGEDLRNLFATSYGFPIDDTAWPEILAAVQARVDARTWAPPTITGWETAVTHDGVGKLHSPVTDGYIEPRIAGITELRVTFDQPLDPATATPGEIMIDGEALGDMSGLVDHVELDGSQSQMTIVLSSRLPGQETYTLSVSACVQSESGAPLGGDRDLVLHALAGDVNGSLLVDDSDMSAVRAHRGQTVTEANCRYDLNGTGVIDNSDLIVVRVHRGHGL